MIDVARTSSAESPEFGKSKAFWKYGNFSLSCGDRVLSVGKDREISRPSNFEVNREEFDFYSRNDSLYLQDCHRIWEYRRNCGIRPFIPQEISLELSSEQWFRLVPKSNWIMMFRNYRSMKFRYSGQCLAEELVTFPDADYPFPEIPFILELKCGERAAKFLVDDMGIRRELERDPGNVP